MLVTTGPSMFTTLVDLDPATTDTIPSMATRKLTELRTATDSAEDTSRVIVSMAAATGDKIPADRRNSAQSERGK